MKAITDAIAARHAQIRTLQADIDALQRAATVLGGKTTAKAQPKKRRKKVAKAKPVQSKAPAKSKAKPQAKPKKRHQWTAAEKAAIGKRIWAKRRK